MSMEWQKGQLVTVAVDLELTDMAELPSDQSVVTGNDKATDFTSDWMTTNATFQHNISFASTNLSDWISANGDNRSWLCPMWNETEGGVGNSFTPSAFFQVIIYSLYGVVFVLALVGNMVVCAVVFTSIRKWTVTNFFIVNMAAGDILMAFFCIPFTFLPTFVLLYWPFGGAMCRIVSFSQAVSVFVSAYTMVAISSDRYLAIVYPLRPRMTRKQAKWIIAAVWLAAVSTALPMLFTSKLIVPEDSMWHQCADRFICTEMWTDPMQKTQYTAVLLLLQYCFPLAVLVFTYGRIGLEIWGKKTPGEAHQHRDLRLARSKRKMIKMMIIVVFFFAFCWLPFNLLQVIGEHYQEIWSWTKINYVVFACHWLAMSHSAYNPIIYCCFNSKFRQGFQVLGVRCGCLKENAEWLNAGDCDCGAQSGTQASAHGDHGCAPLQRVNTYTTCAGSNNLGQHGKKLSCRVLLPTNNHHGHNIHFAGQSPAHQHHQANCKSSCSARFQQHQADSGGQQRARCCSSYSNNAHMQRRFSPSSSAAVCGASVNYNRSASRPPKFVFRTNFPSQSSCHQQQRLLSGAGAGSPTSIAIPSGVNTTAESHI